MTCPKCGSRMVLESYPCACIYCLMCGLRGYFTIKLRLPGKYEAVTGVHAKRERAKNDGGDEDG